MTKQTKQSSSFSLSSSPFSSLFLSLPLLLSDSLSSHTPLPLHLYPPTYLNPPKKFTACFLFLPTKKTHFFHTIFFKISFSHRFFLSLPASLSPSPPRFLFLQ